VESTRSQASIRLVSAIASSGGSSDSLAIRARIASARAAFAGFRYRERTAYVSVNQPARPGSASSSSTSREARARHFRASAAT